MGGNTSNSIHNYFGIPLRINLEWVKISPISSIITSEFPSELTLMGENISNFIHFKIINEYSTRIKKDPNGIHEDPTGIKEDPTGINEDPTGINEDPTGINEDPTGINEDPTGIYEDPTGINEDPTGIINEDSTGIKKDPNGIYEDPTRIYEDPTGINEDPTLRINLELAEIPPISFIIISEFPSELTWNGWKYLQFHP